ncbi:hypothetical protein WKH56_20940 [Priestia sp. SB1]|uniref:hypothetical protein n=1 Tax=Priestia sp. SB1 TaxID=3132359 RepID=UPI00316EC7C8
MSDFIARGLSKSNSNKLEGKVHVKEFGAIGDGSSDDTVALTNAINHCLKNSKVLDFGSGTYLFQKSSDWHIISDFTKFIHWTGKGAKIKFSTLDIGYMYLWKMKYVKIDGIAFEGVGAVGNNPNQNAIGVGIYSTYRVSITGCSFTGFIGDGLLISAEQSTERNRTAQNIYINNNYFNNNGRGGLTIVGGVVGLVESNYFGKDRLLVAPVVGDILHIESDPSTRYGVENLEVTNNIIYGTVNLSNVSWQTGWIGNKDTWIDFNHNTVIVDDDSYSDFGAYGIVSAGGNLRITENEIEVSRNTVSDDLGIGALYLKCNSLILKRNTIKTSGKGTVISIYNWTHNDKGKIISKENTYISDTCLYVYRLYKDTSFSNYHKIVKLINEDYASISSGSWLLSASQYGGNSLKYYLEGIRWEFPNGIEFKNPTANHVAYLKNCKISPSSKLFSWDNNGTAIKLYSENCSLTGTVSTGILPLPYNLSATYKFTSGTGTHDNTFGTSIIGRTNTITKTATGKYQWNAFTKSELYSYSYTLQILLSELETNVFDISIRLPSSDNLPVILEVRNQSNALVDLPDNNYIQVNGKLKSDLAISTLSP